MEESSKTKRKDLKLETALTVLGTEEKKAANVRADNLDDVDHYPGYELVWLMLLYSRYAKDVTEEKDNQPKQLTGSGQYMRPERIS